jgi:hypothetical protein
MADKNMDQKPGENGGIGKEKGATEEAEAAGRGSQLLYTCFNCGAQNYVDPNWTWFTCWKCALQKPVTLPGN